MKKPAFAIVFISSILVLCSPAARAEAYGSGWYGEMQLSVEHENDVSRSYKDEDEVSDVISRVSLGGGHSAKLGMSDQWLVTGYVTYSDHADYDDLDNLAISGGFSYVRQPSISYNSAWYGVRGNVTMLSHRNSDQRDGVLFDIDLNANKRLTNRTVAHLGYRYVDMVFLGKDEDERRRDAAFDTATHELYAGIDMEVSRSIFAFAEYGYRHGGLTSTVSGGIDATIDYEAETEDPVFDNCDNDPRCSTRFAYRIVSNMHRVSLGIVFPIGTMNADLTATYLDAEGEGETYDDWLVKLGLVWNF